jgi:hypothetical protein
MATKPKPKPSDTPKIPDPGPKPTFPESETVRWWKDLGEEEQLS